MNPNDRHPSEGDDVHKDEKSVKLTIVGIIISVMILAVSFVSFYAGYAPDFGVAVHPLKITVDQGGTTATTIDVQNNGIPLIKEYSWDVLLNSSLGTTGNSTRVGLQFTKIEDKPPYTSKLQVSVTPEVPPGSYPVTLKGTGSDGKEHTCNCIIEVTLTPSVVNFTTPTNGSAVPQTMKIEGTSSGNIPEGRYLWVLINQGGSLWWLPQSGHLTPINGKWSISAQFGQIGKDSGTKYHVAAVLVNETDDQYYQNYLHTAAQTGNYPDITPVDSAQIQQAITVTRT